MSIAGITIDYGPFGFIDEYNPGFIPNHSDDMGRYDLQSQEWMKNDRFSTGDVLTLEMQIKDFNLNDIAL